MRTSTLFEIKAWLWMMTTSLPQRIFPKNKARSCAYLMAKAGVLMDSIPGLPVDLPASFQHGWSPKKKSLMDVFMKMAPNDFFKEIIIKKNSEALVGNRMMALGEGEFLCYIWIWLLMSTCLGWAQNDFWSSSTFDERKNPCPYKFTPYMSKWQFKAITQELHLTDANPPQYCDCFWEVRQMMKQWNDHNAKVFTPSCVLCINESMSLWHSMFMCPGWVFCS